MAHYLAVDWDATELRLVLATSQRGSIRILKAESAPLEYDESTDEPQKADIGLTLKQLVKSHKIPNASLLLGLNRASVDMMTFKLPKSKPEDLPDLVKNQALRDSPTFTENSSIDFITCLATEGDHLRAIAVTLTRPQLKQYRSICQAAGFRAKRIEFRPLALAELYWSSSGSHGVTTLPFADQPVLLVQCTQSEVDMVVVDASNIVSVRSIKLPESLNDEDRTARIVSEIARTIAVARQEVEGTTLEKVIVYGNPDEFQSLQERLADQEIETVVQNPFQLPCVVAPVKAKITGLSENPGHYAALFGMILGEQSKSSTRLDFLHPREKPQPFNIARFVVLFLLLVGVVGFGAYLWNKRQLGQLQEQLTGLQTEIEQLGVEYQQIHPRYVQLYSASTWENQQMIWLDELRDISLRLPDEQDMAIDKIQFVLSEPNARRSNYLFVIQLLARVRDMSVLQQINTRFSDGFHRVTLNDQQLNRLGGGYPISCSISFTVGKRDYPRYLQYLTPELWQLSQQMPEFPSIVASSELRVASDEGAGDREQEKPVLPHVLPPEYVPREEGAGGREQGADVAEDDSSENEDEANHEEEVSEEEQENAEEQEMSDEEQVSSHWPLATSHSHGGVA